MITLVVCIVVYLLGVLLLGLFLKLNYELNFIKAYELNSFDVEDVVFYLVISVWPLFIVVTLGEIILGKGYEKLKDVVEVAIKEN